MRDSASSVQVWNIDTGELAGSPVTGTRSDVPASSHSRRTPPISAAAISPDGQRILIETSTGLRLYDVASGQSDGEPWVAPGRTGHHAWRSAPMGISGSADGFSANIQLWESKPEDRWATAAGHTTRILRVAFGAEGKSIRSWGDLNMWMVWPAPSAWRTSSGQSAPK